MHAPRPPHREEHLRPWLTSLPVPTQNDAEPATPISAVPSLATGARSHNGGSYDASAITVLEGLEAVRKRPGMYIGSTGPRGLHHLVYEVVDNAVDEALAGYCDRIVVTLRADGGVQVVDNGRGIPVGIVESEGRPAVEVVLTVLHAGGKFGGTGYAVSGGLHGVGVSVVNALSHRLEVEVRRNGNLYTQDYRDGVPQAPLAEQPGDDATGTIVTFWPNDKVFETVDFDFETLRSRFQQYAFLNKSLEIVLVDERPEHIGTEDEVASAEPETAAGRGAHRHATGTTAVWWTTSRTSTRRRRPSWSTPR